MATVCGSYDGAVIILLLGSVITLVTLCSCGIVLFIERVLEAVDPPKESKSLLINPEDQHEPESL